MKNTIGTFGDIAQRLSGNPLSIIALFIVLVYGFASTVTVFSGNLGATERIVIVCFLVSFPFAVLGTFAWLVSCHAAKLYSPKDYEDQELYVRSLSAQQMLSAASELQSGGGVSDIDVKEISKVAEKISKNLKNDFDNRKKILWVDDRPENNIFERKAFESVGLNIVLAKSTDEALLFLERIHFDAIISDMGRAEGPREGYALLAKVREMGLKMPFFVYAGSSAPRHVEEVITNGGQGSTNNPQDLFKMVTSALAR